MDVAWKSYIDKHNWKTSTVQELLNFSKNKCNNVTALSFSNARKTFNRNKGKAKIDIVSSNTTEQPSAPQSLTNSKPAPTKSIQQYILIYSVIIRNIDLVNDM